MLEQYGNSTMIDLDHSETLATIISTMIDLDHSETLATVISEVVTLTVRASRETVWVNKAIRTFCDNILDHVRTFWSIIMT